MIVDFPELHIEYPGWVRRQLDWRREYCGDRDRMRVALFAAEHNVLHRSGGPFAAAIFEAESGRLVSIGLDQVVARRNSALHAGMMAIMMAQARVGSHTLGEDGAPAHVLYTSCEPCPMCLGATLGSGVQRVVWAATREDLGTGHGFVFTETREHLRDRGIACDAGVLRAEGRELLQLYRRQGGDIFNG